MACQYRTFRVSRVGLLFVRFIKRGINVVKLGYKPGPSFNIISCAVKHSDTLPCVKVIIRSISPGGDAPSRIVPGVYTQHSDY